EHVRERLLANAPPVDLARSHLPARPHEREVVEAPALQLTLGRHLHIDRGPRLAPGPDPASLELVVGLDRVHEPEFLLAVLRRRVLHLLAALIAPALHRLARRELVATE